LGCNKLVQYGEEKKCEFFIYIVAAISNILNIKTNLLIFFGNHSEKNNLKGTKYDI